MGAGPALAHTVTLNAADAAGLTSFHQAGNWSDGLQRFYRIEAAAA